MRDLFRSYMNTLGNPPDAGMQAMIVSAAEQMVGAEKVRADFFAGNVPYDEVIRAEGAANRALKRLKLDKPVKPPQPDFMAEMRIPGMVIRCSRRW